MPSTSCLRSTFWHISCGLSKSSVSAITRSTTHAQPFYRLLQFGGARLGRSDPGTACYRPCRASPRFDQVQRFVGKRCAYIQHPRKPRWFGWPHSKGGLTIAPVPFRARNEEPIPIHGFLWSWSPSYRIGSATNGPKSRGQCCYIKPAKAG